MNTRPAFFLPVSRSLGPRRVRPVRVLSACAAFCLLLVSSTGARGSSVPGFLRREVYSGISGTALASLTNHTKFPSRPDSAGLVSAFETPKDVGDNYGVRLSGYVLPPKTGLYVFYLASDDEGALFLSSDDHPANKRLIAREPLWSPSREWTGGNGRGTPPANKSNPVWLQAGSRYYVEALMKEGGGGDNLAVAWQQPGERAPQNGTPPIPGQFLATPDDQISARPRNAPPEVSITAPTGGLLVRAPVDLTVAATARDADGAVAKVEFYRDDVLLGGVASSPFIFSWRDVPPGTYSLLAVVTDNQGATVASNPVTVTVSQTCSGLRGEYFAGEDLRQLVLTRVDPTVDFNFNNSAARLSPHPSVPSEDWSVRWSGFVRPRYSENYTFSTVSDDGVRLWVDGRLLINNWTEHAETENRGSISLVADTDYEIKMEYFENDIGPAVAKLLWSSPSQREEVIPESRLSYCPKQAAPDVRISDPVNGMVFNVGVNIPITATAIDSDGSVARVGFYANGERIGTVEAAPYSMVWSNALAGAYALTARAIDNDGLIGTSASVSITVGDGEVFAVDDYGTTPANTPLTMDVLRNDSGNDLSIYQTSKPPNGTVTINGNGTLTYTPDPNFTGTNTFTYSVILDSRLYFSGTGHYYEFVAAPLIPWTEAKAAAATRRLSGLQGYLATITSAQEDQFAKGLLLGTAWLGGSDEATEGVWRWMTGPESGEQFWSGNGTGSRVIGRYENWWHPGEPNDLNNEDFLQIIFNPRGLPYGHPTGIWNDVPNRVTDGIYAIAGYIVEYGGSPSDPPRNTTATVTVVVTGSNVPPAVRLTSPGNGAVFTLGQNIPIVAAASDADGVITTVGFYEAEINRIGTATATPFSMVWSNAAVGTYTLTAKARDDAGAVTTSEPVTISVIAPVNRPPTISPMATQRIDEGVRLGFLVQASDPDGPAQTLPYSLVGDSPAGASIQPASGLFAWTPTEAQGPSTNVLTVRVADGGTPSQSATVDFTVIVNEVNLPPVLAATSDQAVQAGATLAIRVTATDPDIPANALTFTLESGAPVGARIDPTSSVFTWTPTPTQGPSTNRVTVRVTDDGVPPLSATQSFSIIVQPVLTNRPPTVLITNPVHRAVFSAGTNIRIQAAARDADSPIVRVEFYAGSTLLATDASEPYEFLWLGPPVGDYELTARAFDAQGASGVSPAVKIAVSENTCSSALAAIVSTVSPEARELDRLQELLFEIGISSRVVSPESFAAADLSPFSLVIWIGSGDAAQGLTDRTVEALDQAYAARKPLYFIGEKLAQPATGLSAAQRETWQRLTRLEPASGAQAGGRVVLPIQGRTDPLHLGRFGTLEEFDYPGEVAAGRHIGDESEVIGLLGQRPVLIAYPALDAPDRGETRTFTQTLGVPGAAGTDLSLQERKELLQNALWWMSRCEGCANLNLKFSALSYTPEAVSVGVELTYLIEVGHNGGCQATGVVVTNRLPSGVEFVRAETTLGTWKREAGLVTFQIGRMTSASVNLMKIVVRPQQSGMLTNHVGILVNEAEGKADNVASIVTRVEGGPRLTIGRLANGEYELRLEGVAGRTYRIEASGDLRQWRTEGSGVGPIWKAPLDLSGRAPLYRFYRAIIP